MKDYYAKYYELTPVTLNFSKKSKTRINAGDPRAASGSVWNIRAPGKVRRERSQQTRHLSTHIPYTQALTIKDYIHFIRKS
jgi:hypothetical protein